MEYKALADQSVFSNGLVFPEKPFRAHLVTGIIHDSNQYLVAYDIVLCKCNRIMNPTKKLKWDYV